MFDRSIYSLSVQFLPFIFPICDFVDPFRRKFLILLFNILDEVFSLRTLFQKEQGVHCIQDMQVKCLTPSAGITPNSAVVYREAAPAEDYSCCWGSPLNTQVYRISSSIASPKESNNIPNIHRWYFPKIINTFLKGKYENCPWHFWPNVQPVTTQNTAYHHIRFLNQTAKIELFPVIPHFHNSKLLLRY